MPVAVQSQALPRCCPPEWSHLFRRPLPVGVISPPVIIDAPVRTYPLLLKGARDHAPSHDIEHGDCENGQLRITRNAPDRHCDHGRYGCDDDFGLDFGHGDGPPRGGGPAADPAGPRAPISPVQRQLSRLTMAKGGRSLNSFWIFGRAQSAAATDGYLPIYHPRSPVLRPRS